VFAIVSAQFMSIEAFPFLVGCNKDVEYKTLIAPTSVIDAKSVTFISDAIAIRSEDLTEPGKAIYREVYNSKVGNVALVFRTINAIAEYVDLGSEAVLKDNNSRDIHLIEGFIISELEPNIKISQQHFNEIHQHFIEYYREFWNYKKPVPAIPWNGSSFNFQVDHLSDKYLELVRVKPFNLGSSPISPVVSISPLPTVSNAEDELWKCIDTFPSDLEVGLLAFDPIGRIVASSYYDQTIRLWDIAAKRERLFFPTFAPATKVGLAKFYSAIAFHPKKPVLVGGRHDKDTWFRDISNHFAIKVWSVDSQNEQLLKILGSHSKLITSVAFLSEGDILISASDDHKVKIWDFNSGLEIATLHQHSSPVKWITVNSNKQIFASADQQGTVLVWDLKTREVLRVFPLQTSVRAASFSPNGEILAIGDDRDCITLSNLQTGREHVPVIEGAHSSPAGGVNSISFNPNGNVFASGGDSNLVKLWNAKTGEEMGVLHGHAKEITSVAFSPNGRILATGSKDCTVKLWS